MEKNPMAIRDSADTILDMVGPISTKAYALGNPERDPGLIKILNAQVESLRTQIVILQQAIDEYAK